MEVMPRFYSFGYGLPFMNSASIFSVPYVFCSRRFMSCLFPRYLVRQVSEGRKLIPYCLDPSQPYHNVRHEEPPWPEFWSIASMDGSGLGWYVSLHCRINKEEQTQRLSCASMNKSGRSWGDLQLIYSINRHLRPPRLSKFLVPRVHRSPSSVDLDVRS